MRDGEGHLLHIHTAYNAENRSTTTVSTGADGKTSTSSNGYDAVGSQLGGATSASTTLQSYLYANNKALAEARGTQQVSLKNLSLQGGTAQYETVGQTVDLGGDSGSSDGAVSTLTGWTLTLQAGDIQYQSGSSGPVDRAATARLIATRYNGFSGLSVAGQAKVVAYVQAQLQSQFPADAQLAAGAQLALHGFIVLADANLTGVTQITDYSLRQIGADGLPGGSVQSHVVRAGDTLQGIAQIYFGSSANWYLVADANGLSGTEPLAEGTTLSIPNKVANSANTSETYKVYNESEIIGSTSPEIRTIQKKKKWWQKLIQILIVVILIVAAVITAGAALAVAGAATPGLLAMGASLATSLGAVGLAGGAAFAAAAGIGAAVMATASILTQGLAIAADLQESFSWKQVGKAAIGGAISGAAAFLAAPAAGANTFSWGTVAKNVAIEGGKQMLLNDGKITSVAGLIGAAASAGALGQMGEFGKLAAENNRVFTSGLSMLENQVRGRGDNAMSWVNLATAAIFDAGAKSGELRTEITTDAGGLNWKYVAVQAIGAAIVGDKYGEDAALNYIGNAIGSGIVDRVWREGAIGKQIAALQGDETLGKRFSAFNDETQRALAIVGVDHGDDAAVASVRATSAKLISDQLQTVAINQGYAAVALQTLAESDNLSAEQLRSVLAKGLGETQAMVMVAMAERDGPNGLRQLASGLADDYLKRTDTGLAMAGAVMHAGGLSEGANYAQAGEMLGLSQASLEAVVTGNASGLSSDEADSLRSNFALAGLEPTKDRPPVMLASLGNQLPLGAISDGLSTAASYVGALNPAAGAAIGGVAMALETFERLPEISDQLEKLKGLVDPEKLKSMDMASAIPGVENSGVQKLLGESVETVFKVVNKLEDKLVTMLERSPNRFAKAAGIAVRQGFDNVKARGEFGEALAGYLFNKSGLFEADSVKSVQNKSGHGIDLIGKAQVGLHRGDWVGFEIKTTVRTASAITYTEGQKKGADSFVRDTLRKASAEAGARWWPSDEVRGREANAILSDMNRPRRAFPGYVIEVTKVNSLDPQVRIFDWQDIGKKR